MSRFEKFGLNAPSELWPLFLAFKYVKDGSNMIFRTSENIIVQQYRPVSNRKFAQRAFTFRDGTEPAMIMTAARSDSVSVLEIHTGRESLTAHSSGRAANLDVSVTRPLMS